ncbi:MAG: DNA polymerase III subunit beta [Chloroflexota bacterium]
MRVSVLQENLVKGLSIVNRAIPSRPSMPVLGNVLISTEDSRLKLAATNLELGITTHIGAKVEEEGAVTVPARTFFDLINALPPERVDMELDPRTQTLTVRCGSGSTNIKGIDATEFPAVPEADADTGVEIPADALRDMIEQVAFSAAKEDNRPILTGVLAKFENSTFTLAAADGYRLAVQTVELESPVSTPLTLIIPAKTLSELSRIITPDDTKVYISVPEGRSQVMFHLEAVDMVSQLIDGKFPDYEQIIPHAHTTSTRVYSNELMRACKWAEIFARESAYTIRVKITPGENNKVPGQMVMMAQSQEKGDNQWTLDVSSDGPGLEVSFNVRYLLDVLNVISEDQIVIETNGAASPGVIKPAGRDNYVYVVMPMSVR